MAITSPITLVCGTAPPLQSPVRILVVEDFQPFRSFLCSMFSKTPELQVICETSDGLEAVQQAEKLQPDLILLDIGLPSLNGIEAARQIRKLVPESKILFLSQESSADVVQEALSLGALGYVVKAHAGNELLVAVESIRQGRQFVSNGMTGFVLTEDNQDKPPTT
jgi:DNA-binding NarL/FixJ family response regulator